MAELERDLRAALYIDLRDFADGRSLPFEWPLEEFDPEVYAEYLAFNLTNIDPIRIAANTGESRHRWLLQARFYLKKGEKNVEDRLLAHGTALRALLPADHVVRGVDHAFRVMGTASIRPPVTTDAWTFLPVELRLETFA